MPIRPQARVHSWILYLGLSGLGLLALFAIYCRLVAPDLCWFNGHMSRDLNRAMDWARFRPHDWLGPEMNYDAGRLFGPAFYWILAPLWMISKSIPRLLLLVHSLTILISARLCVVVKRDLGWQTGLMFFLLFFLMPVHVAVSRTLWNPSLIVPLNIGFILCTVAACRLPFSRWPLLFLGLSGIIAIQIHLATLPGFFACLFVIALRTKKIRNVMEVAILLLAYVIGVLYLSGDLKVFFNSLSHQYHFHDSQFLPIADYLRHWFYHLFITEAAIGDYELFPLLIAIGNETLPGNFHWINRLFALRPYYEFFFCLSFLICLIRTIEGRCRKRPTDLWSELAVIWILFAVIPLYFYTAKKILPYRYGLAIYPAQFLIIPLTLKWLGELNWKGFPAAKPLILFSGSAVALIIFLGNGFFLWNTYKVMQISGRASHVMYDSSEIPLRYKISFLEMARRNAPEGELYKYLHGRIPNKIRQKEFDWDYVEYYGAILKSLPKLAPPSVYPRQHYLITGLRLDEIKQNTRSQAFPLPFHVTRLPEEAVPERVEVSFFDAGGKKLQTKTFSDGDMIIPLADNVMEKRPTEVQFEFKVVPKIGKSLNVTYDDSPYRTVFKLESARLDQRSLPLKLTDSSWLEHRLATLDLPTLASIAGPDLPNCHLKFLLPHAEDLNYVIQYSRVDLYLTP